MGEAGNEVRDTSKAGFQRALNIFHTWCHSYESVPLNVDVLFHSIVFAIKAHF